MTTPATPDERAAKDREDRVNQATDALKNVPAFFKATGNIKSLVLEVTGVESEVGKLQGNSQSASASASGASSRRHSSPVLAPARKKQRRWDQWRTEPPGSDASETKTKMVEAWNDLLKEQLVKKEDTTKTPLRRSNRVAKQPPAGSVLSASSDESRHKPDSFYNGAGSKKEWEIGDEIRDKSVEDALNHLVKNRTENLDEIRYTQPVVNRLVSAVLPMLQKLAQKHLKSAQHLPYFKATANDIEIGYQEKETSEEAGEEMGGMLRYPDSVLYLKGKGDEVPFNHEAPGLACLVAFEHKSHLHNNKKWDDAVLELKRDFANKLNAVDILSPALGYGVITDGIDWHFMRFEIGPSDSNGNYYVVGRRSKVVTICGQKDGSYNFEELAKWLTFLLERSLAESHQITATNSFSRLTAADFLVPLPNENDPVKWVDTFQISKILATKRYFVAKAQVIGSQNKVVLKVACFPSRVSGTITELDNLRMCSVSKNIVSLSEDYKDRGLPFLVLEDAGEPLDKLVVSGNVGKAFAKVVKRDVLEGALEFLKCKNMVHADLHPGNICITESECISEDGKKQLHAKVVDLESAVPEGALLIECPVKHRERLVPEHETKASFKLDESMVLAILWCLWEHGSLHCLADEAVGLRALRDDAYKARCDAIRDAIPSEPLTAPATN